MSVRVLAVDDSLLRAGLVTVLGSDDRLSVVGEAEGGPTAVRLAAELRADVVLMDVEMPGGDGLTAAARLRDQVPDVRVLVLTMFDLDEYVADALRVGAAGFLLKTTPPEGILAGGETVLHPSVVDRLVDSYVNLPHEAVPGLLELTD